MSSPRATSNNSSQSAEKLQGTLYRYPHPHDSTRFIYVGQGAKRDKHHRSGRSSFGRKFKRDFPGIDLPQPIREVVEVRDQLELNELETIWMFQFHTWRTAYPGGYNITFPGSQDYLNLGRIGDREGKRNSGLNAVKTGQLRLASIAGVAACRERGITAAIGRKYGPVYGAKNVESGHIQRMRATLTPEVLVKAGRKAGRLTKERGTGIFSLTAEQRAVHAKNNVRNKVGIHAPDLTNRKVAGVPPQNQRIKRDLVG